MGLDTKYRPLVYGDVLGQDLTVRVCREYVRTGRGYEQSYMFYGPYGTGKTTMGRILARALLCENPTQEGDPCDACPSCVAMLKGSCERYVEIDAATHSGKDDVKKILEEVEYGSFSGHRRLYLVDESHELSRQAMDAFLKPLEETVHPSSLDKRLVCIFCTTEPEKMRPAILSRCAQPFKIQPNTPSQIAARLAWVCGQEGLEFEEKALSVIAEVKECHIRDCLKSIEALRLHGAITMDSVRKHLRLEAHDRIYQLLESLTDPSNIPAILDRLQEDLSSTSAYENTAKIALLAYKVAHFAGIEVPSYTPKDRLKALGEQHGAFLLEVASRCGKRPYRTSYAMFACDVLTLSLQRRGKWSPIAAAAAPPQKLPEDPKEGPMRVDEAIREDPVVTPTGVYILPAAQKEYIASPKKEVSAESSPAPKKTVGEDSIAPELFQQVFIQRVREFRGKKTSDGLSGQTNVGGGGTDIVRGETD